MNDITINTGETIQLVTPILREQAEAILEILSAPPGPIADLPPFALETTPMPGGCAFQFARADMDSGLVHPVLTSIAAWTRDGADHIWEALEARYLELSDNDPDLIGATAVPVKPRSLPWVAHVWLFGVRMMDSDERSTLHCLAGLMARVAQHGATK